MNYLIIGASGLVGGNLYNYLNDLDEDTVIGTFNTFQKKNLMFLIKILLILNKTLIF